MRILYVITLLLSVFAFIENKCPMRILPDFCNDQTDSRCTSHYYYGFSGISFAEKYPSKPRDIRLDITYTEDNFKILNLTWKPPNDSSISYLLGYEIGIPDLTWSNYIYNLTQAHLTPNDSEIVFSFACKVKRIKHLVICFNSLPVPKTNNFYCPEANPQVTEEVRTVNLTYTPAISVNPVPSKPSNHSKLWYIYFGLSIFVLTIIIFSVFLLKGIFHRKESHIFEDALERINKENSNYSDAEFSEDEDSEV